MPRAAASNSGSMRPSPSTNGEVPRLAALELGAVDRAGEVDRHAVAVAAPRASTAIEARALLAQDLERLVDVRVARPRAAAARSCAPRDVADLDLGIDLEGGAELERRSPSARRLRPRSAGSPRRAGSARAPRRRSTSAPRRRALPGAPAGRTAARPSSAAPCPAGSPASSRCARASSGASRPRARSLPPARDTSGAARACPGFPRLLHSSSL